MGNYMTLKPPNLGKNLIVDTRQIYNSNGSRQVEELGPLRRVELTADVKSGTTTLVSAGTSVTARSRTLFEHDGGRPTDGTATVKDQVTRTTIGVQLREHPTALGDTSVTETVYDWAKGLPIKTIQDPDWDFRAALTAAEHLPHVHPRLTRTTAAHGLERVRPADQP